MSVPRSPGSGPALLPKRPCQPASLWEYLVPELTGTNKEALLKKKKKKKVKKLKKKINSLKVFSLLDIFFKIFILLYTQANFLRQLQHSSLL